jgi:hypothetical protein
LVRTVDGVQPCGLAERLLVFGGGVADVVAELGASDQADIGVDFVRLA